MKSRMIWFLAVGGFLLVARATQAQGRFEATPFVGYETSGSYPVSVFSGSGGSGAVVNNLRANASTAYGTFLDYNFTENFQFEFMWDRNNTSYSAHDILTQQYFKAFNTNIDQYQFGVLYTFLNSEHRLRPYFAGSLGFTQDSNSPLTPGGSVLPNRTEFAWSIGGGLKYYISRHVGFRGDIRYLPTYGSSSYGIYCDPFGFCYNTTVSHYLSRGNFVGGIIFRF
jgi:hypothetical protein